MRHSSSHPLSRFIAALPGGRRVPAGLASVVLLAAPGVSASAASSPVRIEAKQAAPRNLDFEEGTAGQLPPGWNSTMENRGYHAELSALGPGHGGLCVRLAAAPVAGPDAGPFGNLMQKLDAAPYRGHRIRYSALVRTDNARAQLWLRVDRGGDRMGFFDNMDDRPITSGGWQRYEITGDIDDDADSVNFGMILPGTGSAWLDDARIEDLGRLVMLAEPPRPLTPRGLDNLAAFARLLGYVRHFHPSDEAAAADWTALARAGAEAAEPARDSAALAQALEKFFRPVAPTLQVFPAGRPPAPPAGLQPPPGSAALQGVSWRHTGYGGAGGAASAYHSERVRLEAPGGKLAAGAPDPAHLFTADLGGGVSCRVALALYADRTGTLPHAAAAPAATPLQNYSGGDRGTRLADVILAWNIFEHFYPYFDVVKADWPGELRRALAAAAADPGAEAFTRTLQRMVAALHDGHGRVAGPGENRAVLPLLLGWAEGQSVILQAGKNSEGLQAGDVLLALDGRPIPALLAERESLLSAATPQWLRYQGLEALRTGPGGAAARVRVLSAGGKVREVVLRYGQEGRELSESRPPKLQEIKPGIFYIDLARIRDEDFTAALPQLEKARGIVFDLRGYPAVSTDILTHLTDRPLESARWNIPMVTAPDHRWKDYDTGGRWNLAPQAPRLKAKLAFLTDGRAISYAESWMGIVEAYHLAEIVGEPTAGTNGNVNPFKLAGGYTVVWTGMKVLKHDGSRHHGVGIRPTVPVSPTLQGIREHRDEQLDRAIQVVSH